LSLKERGRRQWVGGSSTGDKLRLAPRSNDVIGALRKRNPLPDW
jgi:hypothetical protein